MKRMLIGALIIGTMLLNGCSSNNETSVIKDTLILGCSNFSNSLDPSADANSAWGTARYGIGETLFIFDESMNAVPNLAEKYSVDDTKTIWEITIKDNILFSNGNPLTATAVKDSIEYLYNQEISGDGKNAISQFMLCDSITANDDTRTVTIVTSKPYVDLSKILSHVNFIIMDINSSEDMALFPIGTGPYVVTENNVGISAKLSANENYWKGEVPFPYLELIYMTDSTTKALALQSGDIDFTDSITTSNDLDYLRNSKDFTVYETLSARTAFSYINHNGVLSNDTLREAVLLAVDDDTIGSVITGGIYTAGYSILPNTLDYGSKNLEDKTPYNIDRAIELLDNAGIVDTNNNGIREINGEDIVLNYIGSTSKSLDKVAEAVEVNLEQLGIGVKLQILDSTTLWNMTITQEFDLSICSWMTVPDGSPVSFLESWYSKSPSNMNHGGYVSDDYDALYEKLVLEFDADLQKEMIEKLQQILINDFAVMVHGSYTSNLSSNNKIEGVVMPMSEAYWVTSDIKPSK